MKQEEFQVRLSFVLNFVSILFIFINCLYAEEYVKVIKIEGLESMSKKEFLYLIGIKENKKIDQEQINEGLKRVFLKDIFQDIKVEYENGTVKIYVKEKPVIKTIQIEGNKNFSEKFFKKLLSFKKGDRIKDVQLKKSKSTVENELKNRGFVNSKVEITKKCNDKYCDITIYINEGEPLIIKNIKWEGTDDEYIKNLMPIEINSPFNKMLIEDFVKTIYKYFEKQGLIGSKIEYFFKDNELTIRLTKGKKVKFEILGNEALRTKDLIEIARAHFQDKVNEDVIKDSVNSLIIFYRKNGFLDTKITPLIETSEDEWKITYFINEGNKKVVKKIEIEPELENENLKRILTNKEGEPFNPEELDSDRQKIENYLKSQGFFYTKVSYPEIREDQDGITLLYKIQKSEKVIIKSINIQIVNDLLKNEIIEFLKTLENKPFSEMNLFEIKRKIREFYLKAGYPDVVIEINYEIKNSEAELNIKVIPGKRRYFGKSIILGNEKTKTNFIYQRLLPKEEKPYDPYLIEEERQMLYRTGLFSKIDITPVYKDGAVDLIYSLEEAPAGAFEFGFGYGEYERAKGFVDLSYINLFGMNKQIFSRIEVSSLENRSYVTFLDPWLWKDLTFKSSIMLERMDVKNIDRKNIMYKLRRFGISAGFEKKFLDYFKAELLYELTYTKTWDVLPEIVITDLDVGNILISGIKGSLIYDSRDNPFDPKKGWLAGVSSKLSSKFFASELDFIKTSFYVNNYTEITKGLVFATSFRGGWAWLYNNTKDLPISQRFFLGGRDTVRGYAQNTLGPKINNEPTGGNAFLMGNLELRTYIGKNFFLVNFLDFGNVWGRVGDITLSNLKYTTGLGLRYKTPVGPVRIDYGYKLNREKGESHGEIHFSIGHAF